MQPLNVTETVGSEHDGMACKWLENADFIKVMDRVYGKSERFDHTKQEGQSLNGERSLFSWLVLSGVVLSFGR
jgi:hypothetical protein